MLTCRLELGRHDRERERARPRRTSSSAGVVLGKLAGVTRFVADAGVTKVRVVLAGGFTGIATFDRVRLWEE